MQQPQADYILKHNRVPQAGCRYSNGSRHNAAEGLIQTSDEGGVIFGDAKWETTIA